MPPINYANPTQGKLFSLAHGRGSLSGIFLDVVFILQPQNIYVPLDSGIDRSTHIVSNNSIIDEFIRWSFISLTDNKYMLTCRSPRTGKIHVMTCSEYPNLYKTVKANTFDLPVNTEDVNSANQFTLTFVDQSPCFFYLKNANDLYLATTTTDTIQVFGRTIGILTFFSEEQKNNPAINANCIWFIDTLADKIRQEADHTFFIDDQDIKRPVSFAAISEKVNKTIDIAYLNELMGR